MAPQPFIFFLKWVVQYHKALELHYSQESRHKHLPEVNALLTYLAQNEGLLAQLIEAYEYDAPDSLLNAWFKISPNLMHVERPDAIHFDPEMTIGEVIDRVLEVDESLIEVYKMLLRQAGSEELKEALENLLDEEQREEMRMMACERL
jgi:hypothetical protein